MSIILGLTGGIATGKSTADNFFLENNIPVVDTDKIAHDLMEPNQASYLAIVNYFGKDILNNNQEIDRKKLGQIVFSDRSQLAKLNKLTHPLIYQETKRQLDEFVKQKQSLIVMDVPLLFESGFDALADQTLVVSADPEVQLQRLMDRNNLTKTDAMNRINSQMSLKEKEQKANYVIYNNSSRDELNRQLQELVKKIAR